MDENESSGLPTLFLLGGIFLLWNNFQHGETPFLPSNPLKFLKWEKSIKINTKWLKPRISLFFSISLLHTYPFLKDKYCLSYCYLSLSISLLNFLSFSNSLIGMFLRETSLANTVSRNNLTMPRKSKITISVTHRSVNKHKQEKNTKKLKFFRKILGLYFKSYLRYDMQTAKLTFYILNLG